MLYIYIRQKLLNEQAVHDVTSRGKRHHSTSLNLYSHHTRQITSTRSPHVSYNERESVLPGAGGIGRACVRSCTSHTVDMFSRLVYRSLYATPVSRLVLGSSILSLISSIITSMSVNKVSRLVDQFKVSIG